MRSQIQNPNDAAKGNPFSSRAVRPGALAYLFADGTTAGELVERLAGQGWRGQIIGPHGSGKSTLLAALVPQIEAAGRRVLSLTLRDGQRRLPADFIAALRDAPANPKPAILIIDGYEQLSYPSRWRLRLACFRRGWGLLVTAHQNVSLPTLWTTATTRELAAKIVDLLQHGRPNPVSREQIAAALARHNGNLRDTLFELYDEYERQRR